MDSKSDQGDTLKGQADVYNEISADFQLVDDVKLASVEERSRVLDLGYREAHSCVG